MLDRCQSRAAFATLKNLPYLRLLIASCCACVLASCTLGLVVNKGVPDTLLPEPASIAFGDIPVGTSGDASVALQNRTLTAIEVSNLSVSGQPFAIDSQLDLPVMIDSGDSLHLNVQFAPAAVGSATGQLTIISNSPSDATTVVSLSGNGAAESSTATIPASFFGLTVLDFKQRTPSMSFGTTRSWDAYPDFDWSDINPARGAYSFSSLDQFIAINQARGTDIVYTFGRTPRWASAQPDAPSADGPGQCAPPANMADYDNFLTAIATHVAGKIRYWELWNEPQAVSNYCGDIATMVTMAQHASRILKGIDPNAQILSPAANGDPGPAWLATFLAAGGSNYVDVIAFHGYWSANAEDVLAVISNFKAAMLANGAAGKPIWDTESSWAGFGNVPTPGNAQQVGFVAKDYILHWSQGVSRFIWYAYDGGAVWAGLWSSTSGESSAAISYRETYKWLVGATLAVPCAKSGTSIWTCTLSRSSGYAAEVVWSSIGNAGFAVPAQYTVYRDLSGAVHSIASHTVTINDQPILLETTDLQP